MRLEKGTNWRVLPYGPRSFIFKELMTSFHEVKWFAFSFFLSSEKNAILENSIEWSKS